MERHGRFYVDTDLIIVWLSERFSEFSKSRKAKSDLTFLFG